MAALEDEEYLSRATAARHEDQLWHGLASAFLSNSWLLVLPMRFLPVNLVLGVLPALPAYPVSQTATLLPA